MQMGMFPWRTLADLLNGLSLDKSLVAPARCTEVTPPPVSRVLCNEYRCARALLFSKKTELSGIMASKGWL